MKLRWLLGGVLLLGIALGGCQSPTQALQSLASQHAYRLETLSSRPFPLLLAAPQRVQPASRLRLYIEGDGYAWATPTQPSLDPSPRHLMLASLALTDPASALYLARPCQFVMPASCERALWTNRRFAPEVLGSLDVALSALKKRYGNQDFELVGYSGGAALALLLAATRDDIAQVQTLAGNLSPRAWAQAMDLAPLTGSLEPLDFRQRLAHIPQRHWIADADEVVPPRLARQYREALGPGACIEWRVVANATHAEGLAAAWAAGRDRPIQCSASR